MAEGRLVAEKDGFVGRIVFDNPARLNAVSKDMWDGLADAIEAFETDDSIRVIVLEGSGTKAFVSGADISKFENERSNLDAVKTYGDSVNRGYGAVQHCQKPTIAKIRGYCYGGGVGIAICCDLRICAEDASFCIPAAKLGIGYGPENTKVLVDLVGPSFTKEIFYTARRFDAREAERMGLVNRVVPVEELDSYVQGYTDMMTSNAPLSLRATNLIVNELAKDEKDRDMALCARLVDDCATSADHVEGRRAFMEKRRPAFLGR
jgi:enoyl-CoA hydratase/carnithine racemase